MSIVILSMLLTLTCGVEDGTEEQDDELPPLK
jgi:hypothetical protein